MSFLKQKSSACLEHKSFLFSMLVSLTLHTLLKGWPALTQSNKQNIPEWWVWGICLLLYEFFLVLREGLWSGLEPRWYHFEHRDESLEPQWKASQSENQVEYSNHPNSAQSKSGSIQNPGNLVSGLWIVTSQVACSTVQIPEVWCKFYLWSSRLSSMVSTAAFNQLGPGFKSRQGRWFN